MELSSENIGVLKLSLVTDIGPVKFKKLTEVFGNAQNVFSATADELRFSCGLSDKIVKSILSIAKDDSAVEKELEKVRKAGATVITFGSPNYPKALLNLPDSPIVLYMFGELMLSDENAVAVVGTRLPTAYGINVADKISRQLAQSGITIISGLASGIDTCAHKAALAVGGRTIAVLGNGLNKDYPAQNAKLKQAIAKGGVVISEFPMDLSPDRGNFPRRNRIISALSKAVLVVEAASKSGSLITADFAADQGKDVFAVPGPIFSKMSAGTNELIKNGAYIVQSAQDIIDVLDPLACLKTQQAASNENVQLKLSQIEQSILTEVEKNSSGISVDVLSNNLNLVVTQVLGALLGLELKGVVKETPGKIFVRNY